MFEKAQNEGMVDWSKSYYVGFEANDIKAAVKVKALPVLIKPANSEVNVKALALTHHLKIQEFPSLLEFAQSL
jgi:histidinol phosphatase-like enzyme